MVDESGLLRFLGVLSDPRCWDSGSLCRFRRPDPSALVVDGLLLPSWQVFSNLLEGPSSGDEHLDDCLETTEGWLETPTLESFDELVTTEEIVVFLYSTVHCPVLPYLSASGENI